MDENNLWREIVACILGSLVRFDLSYFALERLEDMQLLCQDRRSSHFDQYEQDVMRTLSGEDLVEYSSNTHRRYPFFRVRANQIRCAAERLYGELGSIRGFLSKANSVKEARRFLVSDVPGIGPKQASLFLRNIGYDVDIAVLDAHVLTYMKWVGLTKVPLKSISTVQKYELLEDLFITRSYTLGYEPNYFDLAVWVVVRVAKNEYKTWA